MILHPCSFDKGDYLCELLESCDNIAFYDLFTCVYLDINWEECCRHRAFDGKLFSL